MEDYKCPVCRGEDFIRSAPTARKCKRCNAVTDVVILDKGIDIQDYLDKYSGLDQKSLIAKISLETGVSPISIGNKVRKTISFLELGDAYDLNDRLTKSNQRMQDTMRIERKGRREDSRYLNALEDFSEGIKAALDKTYKFEIKSHKTNGNSFGIIQLSDLHFNELVEDFYNTYSFEIAAKRLKYFIVQAVDYFKMKKIKHVLIAMTGDLMNSNRRTEELMMMATNRSKATVLACFLIEQVICDLNQHFNITVAAVCGNESRKTQDVGYVDLVASDSYDAVIFNMLKYKYSGKKGLTFYSGHPNEQVIKINGFNLLLLHGHSIKGKAPDKEIQQICGKYAGENIKIDHCLFGHIHNAQLADKYTRSSSLVGANAYSFYGLQLSSRASQNILEVTDLKAVNSIRIDLQDTPEDLVGYDIVEDLKAYNTKSAEKLHEGKVILEIKI